MDEKIAVLLLNLGGPDSIQSIKPFLRNLFSDREIIRLPFQPLMARMIARSRSKKVAERYQVIGGKSPILELTNEQASTLETLLNRGADATFKTYVGMRYWHPFISDAVDRIIADDTRHLVVLSMFPHYSRATTGSCINELTKALKNSDGALKVEVIDAWFDNADYLDALAETVIEGLAQFSAADKAKVQVLFSAHALPQEFVDQGDPYPEQLQITINGVVDRVGPIDRHLAYQSRSGPVKWMEPQTDATIIRLAAEGHKHILAVPISFVCDHIETLYEIDIMYRELAEAQGIVEFRRSPSLNSRPAFIKALAGLVEGRLANVRVEG